MAINFSSGTQSGPTKCLNQGHTRITTQSHSGNGPHILSNSSITMNVKSSTSIMYMQLNLSFGIYANHACAAYIEYSTDGGSSYSVWGQFSDGNRLWAQTSSEGVGSDGGGEMTIIAAHDHNQSAGTNIIYRVKWGKENSGTEYIGTASRGYANSGGWGYPGITSSYFCIQEID